MDRRLFVTGLLGVVGTTGIASVLPRPVEALAAVPPVDPISQLDVPLPKLPESGGGLGQLDTGMEPDDEEELGDGFELASYKVRRRRRERRWRRICRRYWHNGHWHRRCRRRPYWLWFWLWA